MQMDEEATKVRIPLSEKMWKWKIQVVESYKQRPLSYWVLLLLSSGAMLVALPAAFIRGRIYNQNGGKSKWIITWVSVTGWPITALLLPPTYLFFKTRPTRLTLKLIISYVVLGFIDAAHSMMFAHAYAYLPSSTATLLSSTMLAFSCLFGYTIVNNTLNASIINSVVIMTAATTIVALVSQSDGRDNVSDRQYIWGFVWDVSASVLHALVWPLYELHFNKMLGRTSFHVALEQRAMVSFFSFVSATIGVVVNNEFEGMKSEAKTFVGGETSYAKLLIWTCITFQLGGIGTTGVIFLASSIATGVQNAMAIPITSVLAVIVLHDPMSGLKIMSLLLTFWGFACYIYATSHSLNILST